MKATSILKAACLTALTAALPIGAVSAYAASNAKQTQEETVYAFGYDGETGTLTGLTADDSEELVYGLTCVGEDGSSVSVIGPESIDTGALTEDETAELNRLYAQLNALDENADENEVIALFEAVAALEEKAGILPDVYETEIADDELGQTVFGCAYTDENGNTYFILAPDGMDTGALTADEAAELEQLYAQVCDAMAETDDPDALAVMLERLAELEQKAGWLDAADTEA